jgi:hypothetical protein
MPPDFHVKTNYRHKKILQNYNAEILVLCSTLKGLQIIRHPAGYVRTVTVRRKKIKAILDFKLSPCSKYCMLSFG